MSGEGGNAYSYDANGNLIQKSTVIEDMFDYVYDFENRLTKVKQLTTSDSVRYEYDGLGQRTRKVGLTDTTRYTWDGLYPVVEWNNQGKLKQTFVYANGLLLGIVDSTLATNRRYYVLHDGLGSSIALTDSAASIKRSLIYSDFGQSLVDTSASGAPSLNRMYAGYSWDGSPANFYWMKGRQSYDPVIGRFGQEDPLLQKECSNNRCNKGSCPIIRSNNVNPTASPQELNPYLYVGNNPINLLDPSGLCFHLLVCWPTPWRQIMPPPLQELPLILAWEDGLGDCCGPKNPAGYSLCTQTLCKEFYNHWSVLHYHNIIWAEQDFIHCIIHYYKF
jgi:YD repeat-containing protein